MANTPGGIAINHFCLHVHQLSTSAGWWKNTDLSNPLTVPAKICLIHSELSEGMEGHRKNLPDDKLPHRPMLEVELADAMIRIGDLAAALGYDLGGAIEEKLEFNKTREDHKSSARQGTNGKAY